MKTGTIIFLVILVSIILTLMVGFIFWLFSRRNENYKTSENYKINNDPLFIDRKPTDARLRKLSTRIFGTEETPVYVIDNFLSPKECYDIIESGKDKLIPSPVTRQDPKDPKFRTSKTHFFTNKPVQIKLQNKVKKLMSVNHPNNEQETSQLQKYDVGNEFKSHNDWFDPVHDPKFYNKGQRTWTVLIYLNNVENGGQTNFTKLKNTIITPKMGTAIIWSNLRDDGKEDKNAEHHGTPVIAGEKYVLTTWLKYKKNPDRK